jgi:hypothetical protein
MTKVRKPLTFENALASVASHIGWKEAARIVGRSENTVRSWSDNDIATGIPLNAALKLDLEFHKAGGDGAPFFNCYATQVESARMDACPEIQAMIASAAKVAKETGEAIEATLGAATLTANVTDIGIAERELEQAINAHRNSLALLRARREHLHDAKGNEGAQDLSGGQGEHVVGSEPSDRAREVAPAMQTA